MAQTVDLNIPHDPAERARQQQIRELAREIASGSFLTDAIARWTEQVVGAAVAAEREKHRAEEARLAEAVEVMRELDRVGRAYLPYDNPNGECCKVLERTRAFLAKLEGRS